MDNQWTIQIHDPRPIIYLERRITPSTCNLFIDTRRQIVLPIVSFQSNEPKFKTETVNDHILRLIR